MAKQYTGIDGALYADGAKIAKVTSWSFTGNVDSLECTTLGDFARKYIYGVQAFNGSVSLLYYESQGSQIDGGNLLTDVVRTTQTPTEPTHTLQLRYENGAVLHEVSFTCLLNQVQMQANVGAIVSASANFQVSGPLTTATFA